MSTDRDGGLTDLALMDLLAGRAGSVGGESLGSLMEADPAGLARAMAQAASRKDTSPAPGDLDFQAEQVADSLERLASRILEDESRERPAIEAGLGRILASVPPPLQSRIIRDLSGPKSRRKHLRASIEKMTPVTLAQVVAAQFTGSRGEDKALHELLQRSVAWNEDREAASRAVGEKLRAGGRSGEEARRILDHLMWAELDLPRRLHLLEQGDTLWKVDFQRIREVLTRLLGAGKIQDAALIIQRYLGGLLDEDSGCRRDVADHARHIIQILDRTGEGLSLLEPITDLFMARVQDETDAGIHPRLSAALGFLADVRLRNGELGPVLDLMRRADALASSGDAAERLKGERLVAAMSRVGSEKIFKELADRHVAGAGKESTEAAELLSRSGPRAVSYLIDRLAEEADRGHRARLVSLLKEMQKAGSGPFTDRLNDPRWFLVRNVVHILGEVGDTSVLPSLRRVEGNADARVRKELIRAYGRIGGPECEDRILAFLSDPDRSIRVDAVHALSLLQERRAPAVIPEIIRKEGEHANVEADVRQEAIHAAGRMRLETVVPALREIISRKGLLGYAETAEIRLAAVQALGAIGGDEALGSLRDAALADNKAEVREAAEAILVSKDG